LALIKALCSLSSKSIEKQGWYPKQLYKIGSITSSNLLSRNYSNVIEQWGSEKESAVPFAPNERIPAWTCWLQGEETMPIMIRNLINIQESHLSAYDHHVVTIDNLDSYITLPGIYFDKMQSGSISPTHFTDLVRTALLMQHGGLWLDATLLLTRDIPKDFIRTPFYFIKGLITDFPSAPKYPEINCWEGYFIGGQKNALLYRFMNDFFYNYWDRETRLVHYLLINQVAQIGIRYLPELQQEYHSLEGSNRSCEMLSQALCENRIDTFFDNLADDTFIFKLSRHTDYPESALKALFGRALS
jgi:hypothetical protein